MSEEEEKKDMENETIKAEKMKELAQSKLIHLPTINEEMHCSGAQDILEKSFI